MTSLSIRSRSVHALGGATLALIVGGAAVLAWSGGAPRQTLHPVGADPATAAALRHAATVQRAVTPDAASGQIGSVAIYVDGKFGGFVRALRGCTTSAEVVTTDGVEKELDLRTGLHVEPCVFEHGRMARPFEAFLEGQVSGGDPNTHEMNLVAFGGGLPVAALVLRDAALTGLQLPWADGASIEPGSLTSTIAAGQIRPLRADSFRQPPALATRPLTERNFHIDIDGVAVAGAKKVSQVVLQRSGPPSSLGPWIVSNVIVETTRNNTGPLAAWYSSSILRATPDERLLELSFLNLTQSSALLTIDLGGVGIFRADHGLGNARVFSLYAETARIHFST